MDLLGALRVLARVVETGSFSAVARKHAVSQAAVTRQIVALEQHFGVRLLHRTTRKLSLTDDGRMLLDLAGPVLDGVEAMEAAVGRHRTSPVGLVRVGVTVVAARFMSQRLPKLLAEHPGLRVELVVSDQFGDMVADRLDLAVRAGDITDASVIMRRSWNGERIAVATPGYLERHGRPATPAALADHTCIVHNIGPHSDVWTFITPAGPQSVTVGGGLIADEAAVVRMAAATGYGIALLGLPEVFDELHSGELVRVLPDYRAPALPISLVYPSRRHLAPRTRVVLDFIERQIHEVRISLGIDDGRGR